MAEAQAAKPAERVLTFRADGRLYALPVGQIIEIARPPKSARAPQSPPGLIGLANIRGDILPLASLSVLLGGEIAPIGPASRVLVLGGDAPLAVAVDEVVAISDETGTAQRLDIAALVKNAFQARPRRRRVGGVRRVEDEAEAIDNRRLVSFEVAGQAYALELEVVAEIIHAPRQLAPTPHSEALIAGVAAYRGGVIPLVFLRDLLGLPPRPLGGGETVVVAWIGETQVGLIADRIGAILPADPQRLDPAPPLLAARAGGEARIKAIYRSRDGGLVSVLDPALLFRDEVMQRLASARREEAQAPEQAETQQRLVVFSLAGSEFALPITAVDEVMTMPGALTPLPKGADFLEGVVNLRGEVLAVIDQRRRFDLPRRAAGEDGEMIVVRGGGYRAGLMVDKVREVVTVADDQVQPAPDLIGQARRQVGGAVDLGIDEARLVLLLDADELLSRTERQLLAAFQEPA